jgi:hypothetical protein
MQTEHSEKKHVPSYGNKVYYLNPLIVRKEPANKKEPEYLYEDIGDSEE